jgi:CHASE3 domain sensor protein
MKPILMLALFAGAMLAGQPALAQRMTQDDLKWVNQCIADNRGATSAEVIRKYCMCMNEKMDDNETRSISQWEKANPKARAECDRVSGWK